ncbi:MAG: MlaD family protein [Bacteroidia bacterium]|nr:MlaD family protein [Bacteroidia bacterium]
MKREVKIGLTLISALAMFYLALTWLNRTQLFAPEEKSYFLHVDNVNGLLEGDPVLIRGYTSGRVLNILPKSDKVEVQISLDSQIKLFEDAVGEIQIKEIMGGKQIAIQTGKEGQVLTDGATIPGRISMDFSSSFSRFGKLMEGVDAERMRDVLLKVDRLLTGFEERLEGVSSERIDNAFSQTELALSRLNRTLADMNAQLDFRDIDTLMEGLKTGVEQGNELLSQASEMTQRIEDESLPKIEQSLNDLPELMEGVQHSLNQVNDLMGKLNNENSIVGRILTDEELSRQLDTTLFNLNKTLEQIHSKRVIVGLKRKKKDL